MSFRIKAQKPGECTLAVSFIDKTGKSRLLHLTAPTETVLQNKKVFMWKLCFAGEGFNYDGKTNHLGNCLAASAGYKELTLDGDIVK